MCVCVFVCVCVCVCERKTRRKQGTNLKRTGRARRCNNTAATLLLVALLLEIVLKVAVIVASTIKQVL